MVPYPVDPASMYKGSERVGRGEPAHKLTPALARALPRPRSTVLLALDPNRKTPSKQNPSESSRAKPSKRAFPPELKFPSK